MENTDKINSFDTSREALSDIIKYRENKLRKHFGYLEAPYPEEILIMLGDMNMDMDQLGKAEMYLEFAIEYYPQSALAHDAMAKYYESQKDITNALNYAIKASKLDDGIYYKNRVKTLKNK